MGILTGIGSLLGGPAGAVIGGVASSLIGGAFSKSSAKDQMKFQEEMSNTAHQREIQDLKRAGLNPILSAKYGGASTPPGAGYQIPNIASGAAAIQQMSMSSAQKINVVKQSQVLDRDVALADLDYQLYKKYPMLRVAEKLQSTSAVSLGAATALTTGEKVLEKNSNSAKSYGTKINKYKGTPPVGYRWEGNYFKKKNTITNQEMLDINKQRRQQLYDSYK